MPSQGAGYSMFASIVSRPLRHGCTCGTRSPDEVSSAIFFEDEAAAERFPNPVVQILTIKPMAAKTEGAPERYRLVVSDGEMFCMGMVATQSHHLIMEQQLDTHKIVRIKQYQKSVINTKRLGTSTKTRVHRIAC